MPVKPIEVQELVERLAKQAAYADGQVDWDTLPELMKFDFIMDALKEIRRLIDV